MRGNTILGAVLATLALLAIGVLAALAAPGDLDTSFSADGMVTTDIGSADSGRAVAVQSDGKIVVVGYVLGGGTYDFAVLRYTSAGVLDTTFSGDGQVTIDIDSEHDLAYSVAIQADGKIVVGGVSGYASANAEFGLARLTSAGELDTSFSTDGKLEVGFGFGDDISGSLAIQDDGRVVVAGYGHNGTDFDLAIARVTTAGALDTDFSGDGKVLVPVGAGHDYGYAVAVASDGDIVVAGSSHNGTDDDVAVVRLTTAGVLDTAFDSDGLVTTAIGGASDIGRGLAIAADGDIVVAGSSHNGANEDFAVVRYSAAGALDTLFDSDGKATFGVGPADDNGRGVAIQADGKILIVGESDNGANDDVAVLRLTAAGALDTGFSGDGSVTTGIGSADDVGYGVALASTGRIVVGGVSRGVDDDFAVVAYTGTSVPGAPSGLAATAGD
ncbi:MAG: delta-60 repeat domain-containing protein, partial [Acidimicrobiales bacterium]|nr:delta-60 repeat domain-containing protein [Acidimicrobiales bacterium]